MQPVAINTVAVSYMESILSFAFEMFIDIVFSSCINYVSSMSTLVCIGRSYN